MIHEKIQVLKTEKIYSCKILGVNLSIRSS